MRVGFKTILRLVLAMVSCKYEDYASVNLHFAFLRPDPPA